MIHLTGSLTFAYGLENQSLLWMLAGRAGQGLVSDALHTQSARILQPWFSSQGDLALAIGCQLTLFRLANVFGCIAVPLLANSPDYHFAFEGILSLSKRGALMSVGAGIALSGCCLPVSLLAWLFDLFFRGIKQSSEFQFEPLDSSLLLYPRSYPRSPDSGQAWKWIGPVSSTHAFLPFPIIHFDASNHKEEQDSLSEISLTRSESCTSTDSDIRQARPPRPSYLISPRMFNNNVYQVCISTLNDSDGHLSPLSPGLTSLSSDRVEWAHVTDLDASFWILTVILMLLYSSILPIVATYPVKCHLVLGQRPAVAGWIMAIPELTAALATCSLGQWILLKSQERELKVLLGCGVSVSLIHLWLMYTNWQRFGLMCLGLTFAVICSVGLLLVIYLGFYT